MQVQNINNAREIDAHPIILCCRIIILKKMADLLLICRSAYKMRKMNFTLSKHVLARDLFESFQINFIIPVFLP